MKGRDFVLRNCKIKNGEFELGIVELLNFQLSIVNVRRFKLLIINNKHRVAKQR